MPVTRPCIVGPDGLDDVLRDHDDGARAHEQRAPRQETDSWASASIDERIQREVNRTRVMSTIVPYLAQHPDRFFGSFIVLVPKGLVEFEPLTELVGKPAGGLPQLAARTSAT